MGHTGRRTHLIEEHGLIRSALPRRALHNSLKLLWQARERLGVGLRGRDWLIAVTDHDGSSRSVRAPVTRRQ